MKETYDQNRKENLMKGSGVGSTVIWYDASQIKGQEAFCSDGGGQFRTL